MISGERFLDTIEEDVAQLIHSHEEPTVDKLNGAK